jgi:hypothetical protein
MGLAGCLEAIEAAAKDFACRAGDLGAAAFASSVCSSGSGREGRAFLRLRLTAGPTHDFW